MTSRRPPDLIQMLTRAERLMARRLSAILDAEGCSLDAWRVMTLLSDGAGHQMTEVAEQAFLAPATLTKLVDHLVDNNVVYRRVDDLDRRRIRAYLTARGRSMHQRIDREIQASVARLTTTSEDTEQLQQMLSRLIDALTTPAVAQPVN
jgi:MarR family transcriptional regulator, organic hydroperoxide resistance regulator